MSVMRFFAHGNDGKLLTLRNSPSEFNEQALVGLDVAIATAKEHGIKVTSLC
jgi:hypothetical protein